MKNCFGSNTMRRRFMDVAGCSRFWCRFFEASAMTLLSVCASASVALGWSVFSLSQSLVFCAGAIPLALVAIGISLVLRR